MLTKPKRLQPGSKVAAVCLSNGLASEYPELFAWGKKQLEEKFQLELIPMSHTLKTPVELYKNPSYRLEDFYEAWERPDIDGVISVIGGDDSVRLLKGLDRSRVIHNAKPFIGCSDTTVSHLFLNSCGISSFYGPAVLYGIADFAGMNLYSVESFRKTVMSGEVIGELRPYEGDSVAGFSSWKNPNLMALPPMRTNPPWRWLQGSQVKQGRLFGGCIEVICPIASATAIWPRTPDFWDDKILFLEYSHELANSEYTLWFFRSLAAQGIFERIQGLLLGRQHHLVQEEESEKILSSVVRVVRDEEGIPHLPIVADMDFGHVQPMLTLPYGALTEIDGKNQRISILESGTS